MLMCCHRTLTRLFSTTTCWFPNPKSCRFWKGSVQLLTSEFESNICGNSGLFQVSESIQNSCTQAHGGPLHISLPLPVVVLFRVTSSLYGNLWFTKLTSKVHFTLRAVRAVFQLRVFRVRVCVWTYIPLWREHFCNQPNALRSERLQSLPDYDCYEKRPTQAGNYITSLNSSPTSDKGAFFPGNFLNWTNVCSEYTIQNHNTVL